MRLSKNTEIVHSKRILTFYKQTRVSVRATTNTDVEYICGSIQETVISVSNDRCAYKNNSNDFIAITETDQ